MNKYEPEFLKALKDLERAGLIELEEDNIVLTETGIMFMSNIHRLMDDRDKDRNKDVV